MTTMKAVPAFWLRSTNESWPTVFPDRYYPSVHIPKKGDTLARVAGDLVLDSIRFQLAEFQNVLLDENDQLSRANVHRLAQTWVGNSTLNRFGQKVAELIAPRANMFEPLNGALPLPGFYDEVVSTTRLPSETLAKMTRAMGAG